MRSLLPLLPKPSHYAGIEDNACRKDPQKVSLRVALAFPDTYDVGMSYLGQKILYGIVNSEPRWWAERVMAPELEVAEILRAHAAPLATLESDTPLAHMHCLSFSITHELCYTNVLYMLDLAGIPLRSRERPQDLRACPLVIAGGGALLSAEPLTPFMDMMVLPHQTGCAHRRCAQSPFSGNRARLYARLPLLPCGHGVPPGTRTLAGKHQQPFVALPARNRL